MDGKSPVPPRRNRVGPYKAPRDDPEYPTSSDYIQVPGNLRNFAKSAVRALQVLDEFAVVQRPLRAMEIGQSLGLHPSSADQLLKTMVDSGYLLFDDRKKVYFPSSRLGLFANWLSNHPLGALHSLIDHVQAATDERTMISFRQGNDMQLALIKGQRAGVPEIVTPGIRFPLLNSGTGIAALCTYDESEIREIVERARRHRRDRHISIETILCQVTEARQLGYALGRHDVPDRLVIALPLIGADMPQGYVVSIAADRERITPRIEAIAEKLKGIVQARLNCRTGADDLAPG